MVVPQNKAVRIFAKVSLNEHTQPLFKDLRILPLNDLYDLSLGTFMFKQVKNMASIAMDDTVHNRDIHSYFTGSAQNVHTTFRRTVKVAKSFFNKGSQYYYNLHVNIRCVRTHGNCKKIAQKSHFLSNQGST